MMTKSTKKGLLVLLDEGPMDAVLFAGFMRLHTGPNLVTSRWVLRDLWDHNFAVMIGADPKTAQYAITRAGVDALALDAQRRLNG